MTSHALRCLVLLLGLFAAGCGINQEHYETAHDARLFGAAERGMLPECVPDSATNVHMVIDHDTGRVWVWCDLDRQTEPALRSNVRAAGWAEVRASAAPPPFAFHFPDWNPILGGRMNGTPAGDFYFVFGPNREWHGLVNSSGRCWITLTAPRKGA
ncbi:MAG TPA: hypothetical protein VL284_14805 [Thermoanaerobaculia bacterium]|nr:hypothetical protein [Thermoanaerobaculia bacterium]